MRRFVMSAFAAIALAGPLASQPVIDTERLLSEAESPAALRASLLEHAASIEATNRGDAGAARYYAGLCYERAGMPDSAIACYRRALELRDGDEERIALADGLMARRASGDVAEAVEWLERRIARESFDTEMMQTACVSRLAWGLELAGHADSARALLAPLEGRLSQRPRWRYRIGATLLSAGDLRHAYHVLIPLAVTSRTQDKEVMSKLREIADRLGGGRRLDPEIDRLIHERDRAETAALARIGGERGRFLAADGFRLGGAVVRAQGKGRARGAVVLVAPGDSLADYDSLSVALTRAGYAVMLMDVRGSSWSASPSWPEPDSWAGHEDAMQSLTASDASDALRGLAQASKVDTTRWFLVGVGSAASIAVEAAELNPRVLGLLLVSPTPAAVERGAMRARLARMQIPVYFQSGLEDFDYAQVTDALYQAGNRGASRIADARVVGHGPRQFYHDPALTNRFVRWLEETTKQAGRRTVPSTKP